MSQLENIAAAARSIADGQAQLKARAMLYQAELKETVAAELGLTFEQVDRPYAIWAEIRTNYLKYKELSRRWRQRQLAAAYKNAAIRTAKNFA